MNFPKKRPGAGPEILLVNPWIYDFAAYDLWAKPLGLLYIASVLRTNGYRVRLLDCLDRHHSHLAPPRGRTVFGNTSFGCGKFRKQIVPKPPIYEKIPRRYSRYGISEDAFCKALAQLPAPEAVLITSGMTYWYPGAFRAIELLRSRFPQTLLLLGGIYATLCPEHARRFSGADHVITGAGEVAALRAVDNICRRRPVAENYGHLDSLPSPAFDLYIKNDYVCVLTSRGCPHSCTYCASRLLSNGYRRRSVESVLAELLWLRRGLGVKNIAFYDDALLVDSAEHIKPILEETILLDLDCWFHTPNGLHTREVDLELAELMFRSGFKTVRLSFDTADAIGRQGPGRKVTRGDLTRALQDLELAGYRRGEIGVYLLVGLPGQSYQEILGDIDFAAGLGATIRLALYSPIPGTADWRNAVQEGHQDPQADPLLHNNTIFPTASEDFPAERFDAIKRYVKSKNMSLS